MTREEIMQMDELGLIEECLKQFTGMEVAIRTANFIYDNDEISKFSYEVEEKIKELGKQFAYVYELRCSIIKKHCNIFELIHASPEQRRRAALLCIGGI